MMLLVHSTHFTHCIWLSHFPTSWNKAKMASLPKHGQDPKFPQNLRPSSLLSITRELFEKVTAKVFQKQTEGRNLPVWFSCMSKHVTLMYEDSGSRDFQQQCNYGLRYFWISSKPLTLRSTLAFRTSYQNQNFWSAHIIQLISSFYSNGKFMVSVEDKMPKAKEK
jgi:hypothetical protein